MKTKTKELVDKVLKLRQQGMSYRAIQKELGFSSSSMVDYYLKKSNKEMSNWLTKLVILPERHLTENGKFSDAYMCVGFNAYREELIQKLQKLKE